MKAWFEGCRTVDEAKARYRDLMKEYHPDHGGDTETAQAINVALEAWLREGMGRAFRSYEHETGRGFAEEAPYVFADILGRVVRMSGVGRIEIIGYWIYAFDSFPAHDALRSMGFWFSGKHKAWVYNGGERNRYRRTKLTTDMVRDRWGCTIIDKEPAAEALPA